MSQELDKQSPTFCVLPFMHVMASTDGSLQLCCLARDKNRKPDGTEYRMGFDSFDEYWNSEVMRETRRRMLAGEKVEACRECYHEESLESRMSPRQGFNQFWLRNYRDETLARVEEARHSGFRVARGPLYVDLRQGNHCNLKCRSCNPHSSRQIQREYSKLAGESAWFRENISTGWVRPEVSTWYAQPRYVDELKAMLPELRKIYLTGGEPTLIESNYEIMELCVAQGYARRLRLSLNTNLSNIQDRFLELLGHFEEVELNLSVDGVGAEQEYLRFGSQWETIERNCRRLDKLTSKNLKYRFNPLFQFANALTITKLFEFTDSFYRPGVSATYFEMHPLIAIDPPYIDPRLLPSAAKKVAYERLERYMRDSVRKDQDYFLARAQSMLELLRQEERPPGYPQLYAQFAGFTRLLDRERGQDFRQAFPELCSFLEADETFRNAWERAGLRAAGWE